MGMLGPPARIDGELTLDVFASADAVINATWGKGTTPLPFEVVVEGTETVADVKPKETIAAVRKMPAVRELVATFPADGGPITIRTIKGPIKCGGIEFQVEEGTLSNGSDPSPFRYYLTGNDMDGGKRVLAASLGEPADIDGEIVLNIFASPNAVIKATWGKGASRVPFEVVAMTVEEGDEEKDEADSEASR